MASLVERYGGKIRGVLSCFNRVVITGTMPDICHARAMERYLRVREVRLFDYPRWAGPLREEVLINAEHLKEERVKEILAERGSHRELVHIFSAMEPCPSFRPWHETTTG